MGGTSLAAYDGDTVLARTAAALNIPMIQSGASLTPLEDVKEVGPTAWFQAYLPGRPRRSSRRSSSARSAAGFETLVLTVDVQVAANRENNFRNGYSSPLKPTPRLAWDGAIRPRWLFGTFLRTIMNHGMPHLENMGFERIPILSGSLERPRLARDGLSWEHVELMRRIWKGKLVLKGVLAKEDVRIARESGVDGIMVSNHGGRQLDGTVAPLRMLPAVKSEAGNMAIMMDSGIRRGTDVLKALALGADFVFIGRPFLYAAAIAGEAGVRHAVKLLREEIDRNMAMLGISKLAEMRREMLVPRPPLSSSMGAGAAPPGGGRDERHAKNWKPPHIAGCPSRPECRRMICGGGPRGPGHNPGPFALDLPPKNSHVCAGRQTPAARRNNVELMGLAHMHDLSLCDASGAFACTDIPESHEQARAQGMK